MMLAYISMVLYFMIRIRLHTTKQMTTTSRKLLQWNALTNRNDHKYPRNTECQGVTIVVTEAVNISSKYRRQECGDQAAGVDGEVEETEEVAEVLLLFREPELVAAKSRHARLNAARAKCYQQQCYYREFSATNCILGCYWMQCCVRFKITHFILSVDVVRSD